MVAQGRGAWAALRDIGGDTASTETILTISSEMDIIMFAIMISDMQ